MRAIYLPFGADATVVADGDNFKFSKGTCSYYLTATQSYTVDNGSISGTFSMALPDGFMLFYYEDASAATTTINPVAGQSRTINITNMNASGASTWAATTKPQIVDLGLSVKWASRPLGASNENAYGYYYAWGETAPYHKAAHAQDADMSASTKWEDGKSNGYAWASYSFWGSGSVPNVKVK